MLQNHRLSRSIRIVSLIAVVGAAGVLTVTALPTLSGGHLNGNRLMIHMMASGVMVAALPIYGLTRLLPSSLAKFQSRLAQVALRCLLLCGMLTIATMFACMLPVFSTSSMESLISTHGWLGYLTAIAALGVMATSFLSRR